MSSMQVAGALGVAVLGTIATDRTKTLARRPTAGERTHSGYQLGFSVAAAFAIAALLVASVVLRTPSRGQTAPVGERTAAPGAEPA